MSALFDFLRKKPKKVESKIEEPKKVEKKIIDKKEFKKTSITPKKKKGDVYRILKEPHISEKSTFLSDQGKYVFKVYPGVNKIQAKNAIQNHYAVKVKDVNIINIKSKTRMLRGKKGTKTGYKKAIVTLEQGQKIEIMPH
ncbi:50S ribosomal protein L23 [Patescibacteria group bacterium]|nr:50S ribosomal protein L23 [Patescibacteria group bacterium]MBU3922748.1 50S ribosomal protein L23 [Patescibacteria group bacterium]